MSKSGAVIILVIVAVLVLALGFFAVYPTVINYGEYKQYHSPLSLIQASGLYTDNVVGTYTLKLNTDAKAETVVKQIKQRLASAYGYYGSSVSANGDVVSVTVPVTANKENATADTIMSNVTTIGKVEVTNLNANSSGSNGSRPNYSTSSVVLKPTHFKSASSRRYISGTSTFYICEVTLNAAGEKAAKALTSTTPYIVALDETLATHGYLTSSNTFQIYAQSETQAKVFASYVNSGALVGELSLDDTVTNTNNLGLIVACVFAAIVVVSWIVLIVRFKALAVSAIYCHLIVLLLFVICAALLGLQIFNTAAFVGLLLGYALMFFFTYYTLNAIHGYMASKTNASARYKGYQDTNKLNLIVHAVTLVLSVVLWLIPTVVTAPLGNVLFYMTLASFIATFGLNRPFNALVMKFIEE